MPESEPTRADRQDLFEAAIKQDPSYQNESWGLSGSYGNSNRARILDGGMFFCGPNLESNLEGESGHVFATSMLLSPEDEFWFAAFISSEIDAMQERLRTLQQKGEEGVEGFSDRNNNAKLYLVAGEGIFLENKGLYKSLTEPDGFHESQAGPSVKVDKFLYSVYPISATGGYKSSATASMLNYLSRVAGEEVYRVSPWPSISNGSVPEQRTPKDLPVSVIQTKIEELGGYYSDRLVERYHIGLNHNPQKHFVILTGLSGSGKTSLVTRYARAIHGVNSTDDPDPLLYVCPVRPEWTDPTELIGYRDVISGKYIVPDFLEAILRARDNPGVPVFVCLDEMNLARAEYYLSDVLSIMESGEPLSLHSSEASLRGNNGEEIPASIKLPGNLYITGTVNIDETTRPLSDKVLDRAVVIDTSSLDLEGYLNWFIEQNSDLSEAVNACQTTLVKLHELTRLGSLGFGYRVAEEFIRYIDFAMSLEEDGEQIGGGGRDVTDDIDDQITQKIIPKLRGRHQQGELLNDLHSYFESENYNRSKEAIEVLKEELSELGSFQAMR